MRALRLRSGLADGREQKKTVTVHAHQLHTSLDCFLSRERPGNHLANNVVRDTKSGCGALCLARIARSLTLSRCSF